MNQRVWANQPVRVTDPILKEEIRRFRHRHAQRKYKQKLMQERREVEQAKEKAVLQFEAAEKEIAKKDAVIEGMKAVMMTQKEELQQLRKQLGLPNMMETDEQLSNFHFQNFEVNNEKKVLAKPTWDSPPNHSETSGSSEKLKSEAIYGTDVAKDTNWNRSSSMQSDEVYNDEDYLEFLAKSVPLEEHMDSFVPQKPNFYTTTEVGRSEWGDLNMGIENNQRFFSSEPFLFTFEPEDLNEESGNFFPGFNMK